MRKQDIQDQVIELIRQSGWKVGDKVYSYNFSTDEFKSHVITHICFATMTRFIDESKTLTGAYSDLMLTVDNVTDYTQQEFEEKFAHTKSEVLDLTKRRINEEINKRQMALYK